MLRMMKEEARLLRRSRNRRRKGTNVESLPLRTCRTAHDRLHVHSSMQRRLAGVMYEQHRPFTNTSCDNGSVMVNSLERDSVDSFAFLSQSRSVDSASTMQRLTHAITSHQRNSTADLLDERLLASESKVLKRTHQLKIALKKSKLDSTKVRAAAVTQKQQSAKTQRKELETALRSTRTVLQEELNKRREVRQVRFVCGRVIQNFIRDDTYTLVYRRFGRRSNSLILRPVRLAQIQPWKQQ